MQGKNSQEITLYKILKITLDFKKNSIYFKIVLGGIVHPLCIQKKGKYKMIKIVINLLSSIEKIFLIQLILTILFAVGLIALYFYYN